MKRRSLATILVSYVMIAALAVSSLLIIVQVFLSVRSFEEAYVSNWQARVATSAAYLGPKVEMGDVTAVHQIARQLLSDDEAMHVQIRKSDGSALFSQGTKDAKALKVEEAVLDPKTNSSIGLLEVSIKKPPGYFFHLLRNWPLFLAALVGCTLMRVGLYFILERYVVRPIERTSGMIRNYEHGEPVSIRADDKGVTPVELVELDNAFLRAINRITDGTKARERALNDLRDALHRRMVLREASRQAMFKVGMFLHCEQIAEAEGNYSVGVPVPPLLEDLWLELGSNPEKVVEVLGGKGVLVNLLPGELSGDDVVNEYEIDMGNEGFWSITAMHLPGGATAVIGRDITVERDQQSRLISAQRNEALSQLTGGVAHDFNNVLGVVLGNMEMLMRKNAVIEHEKYINAAVTAARKGANLTSSLLSFARNSQLTREQVDINQIVHSTLNWSSRVFPRSITIEISLQDKLWPVFTDRAMTENALLNIMLNSRDAMPDGGRLTFETQNLRLSEDFLWERNEDVAPGRYVMLAITDTGNGISSDVLKQIFDPFFTTKPTGQGSGVGLSMVQGFMRQSGGIIRVYSELGEGTTFKLFFPVLQVEEKRPLYEPQKKLEVSGAHILVVEDEDEMREVVRDQLEFAGYRVSTAENADHAIIVYESTDDIDLVLSDVVMPGDMKGPQLIKALREVHPDLKAVFMSGYAQEATVHGNGLRPEDIRLMKPVDYDVLVEAIEKTLALD